MSDLDKNKSSSWSVSPDHEAINNPSNSESLMDVGNTSKYSTTRKSLHCIPLCQYDQAQSDPKGKAYQMLRCCTCMAWFHFKCVKKIQNLLEYGLVLIAEKCLKLILICVWKYLI